MYAHAAGDSGVIDIRILDRGADIHLLDAAAVPRGHRHEIHVLLMISAIVMDDVKHRNLVMRRRPQRAWIKHEVAVAAEGNREAARLLVGERRTERGRQIVTNSSAARTAIPLIGLIEVPKPMHPV